MSTCKRKCLYFSQQYASIVSVFEKGGIANSFCIEKDGEYARYFFIKRDIAYEVEGLEKERYFDIVTPFDYGGISYSSVEILPYFFEEFSKWCKANAIVSEFVRFDPCRKFDIDSLSAFLEIIKINDLIYIDLQDDFWLNYSKGRRSDIAKAKKLSYSVVNTTVDVFHPIYIETMVRNGSNSYFYFSKQALDILVEQGFARVFGVFVEGRALSSIVILDDETHSYYFLVASSYETLSFDTNALLLHEVAMILKNEGKSLFFLGGGRQGVYDFKSRFSKKTAPYYIGRRIHNQEVYNELVKLTKHDKNNFFPQYREKII